MWKRASRCFGASCVSPSLNRCSVSLSSSEKTLLWALSPHLAGMGTAYIRYSGRASSSYGGSGSCGRTFFANKSATGRENVSRWRGSCFLWQLLSISLLYSAPGLLNIGAHPSLEGVGALRGPAWRTMLENKMFVSFCIAGVLRVVVFAPSQGNELFNVHTRMSQVNVFFAWCPQQVEPFGCRDRSVHAAFFKPWCLRFPRSLARQRQSFSSLERGKEDVCCSGLQPWRQRRGKMFRTPGTLKWVANGFREEAASRCFSKMGFCLPGMEDVGGVPCPSFTSILTIYILSSQTVVALGVCPCEDGEVEADETPPQPEDVRGLSARARFYLQSWVDAFGQQVAQGQARETTYWRCAVLQVQDPGCDAPQHHAFQKKANVPWQAEMAGAKLCSHCRHKVPDLVPCKAATQVIDRAWRFLPGRVLINHASRIGSAAPRATLGSAQYEYWHRKVWFGGKLMHFWSTSLHMHPDKG